MVSPHLDLYYFKHIHKLKRLKQTPQAARLCLAQRVTHKRKQPIKFIVLDDKITTIFLAKYVDIRISLVGVSLYTTG
jgi:hypothetical protein